MNSAVHLSHLAENVPPSIPKMAVGLTTACMHAWAVSPHSALTVSFKAVLTIRTQQPPEEHSFSSYRPEPIGRGRHLKFLKVTFDSELETKCTCMHSLT